MKDKLPTLTQNQIDKIFKDFKVIKNSEPKAQKAYFNCIQCEDTGWIKVYGGPNRPCDCGKKI